MTPDQAEVLFAGSGHSFAELNPLIEAGKPLPAFDLKHKLDVTTAVELGKVIDTQNVVGLLEGSDPALRAQYLVISAHLDHLGVGAPVRGDAIYKRRHGQRLRGGVRD